MNHVYVIGHKNPDTDSISSVIGYSSFLNQKSPGKYLPVRCGEISNETEFALDKFGLSAPELIDSVEPNISDLPFIYSISAREDVPTIDIIEMMDENNVRNLPVTDSEGRLKGLMSEHGLAQAYIGRQKIEQLSITPIKPETLGRILQADLIVPTRDLFEGKVYIAIDALHVTLSRLTENDVAIVGDNEPAQLALISAGIAALIIADGAPVGERVINAAKKKEVALLATKLDAFGVGKMINLSLPAGEIMATDVEILRKDDSVEYAKQIVSSSRYRTACVVDEDKKLLGMISRNTFLDEVQKQVILLDHNEFTQAVDGIESAEILEIIDHHRIGAVTTLKPISFLNEPVGSTATIIAGKFYESGITPEKNIAGILLSGILSDTMVLRLSTTSDKDRAMVDYLAGIAEVDPVEFGTELIKRSMQVEGDSMNELLMRDVKKYELFGRDVVISQVMIPTFEFAEENKDEISTEINNLRAVRNADVYGAMFTSVFDDGSLLFLSADEHIVSASGAKDQPLMLKGVMSRKNDFIPWFGKILKEFWV
ncbi:putative manganese-dependent inorganic diphosphatase [Methanoplanus endosymbiosus]|uniref:inorganic diphosphatase n=1 Tax=Methanoplanus endosymbiosus TaxID=33865 RepID=A0A9E7TH99_9EURY|nr:putative manganese-dependent inorganic diphosphatase [Methanoplanus endosymbiosus]UUX92457.1 putative manganese-dependent inorganic diphosphatase [Methanoplanus endosymbiosus]